MEAIDGEVAKRVVAGLRMTVHQQEKQGPDDTPSSDLDRLIGAAAQAARVLIGSRPSDRATWLELVADRLDAAADDLVPLAAQETHLGVDRLQGELKRTTFQLRLFAEILRDGSFLQATIDHADPAWPMGPRPDLRRMLRPLGPVAIYAASNFPFAFSVAGGDTASALAAGCPVLLKANPSHPELSAATGAEVADALADAGAPDGIFAVVMGFETGIALVKDPRIRAASFTGSLRGGRALFDLAVSRPEPIPFYGELGSVNPAFVTREAGAQRADEVAAGFVGSMSLGNGQFCTKPGLLFVPAGIGLENRVAALASERPAAPMLSEHIRSGYSKALAQLAERPGMRVIAGKVNPEGDPAPTVLATTVSDLLADSEALTQECFGPAALVVSYSSEDELLAAARVFDGQLTATIHGSGQEPVTSALLDVLTERVGRVVWNGWPTGVSVTYAQHHGGPYPATTSVQTTSVGTAAIERFLRPVTYQDAPDDVLPPALQEDNPWCLPRRVDGVLQSG
jgi:NADP-dependent aldehyde dehydrogenase